MAVQGHTNAVDAPQQMLTVCLRGSYSTTQVPLIQGCLIVLVFAALRQRQRVSFLSLNSRSLPIGLI